MFKTKKPRRPRLLQAEPRSVSIHFTTQDPRTIAALRELVRLAAAAEQIRFQQPRPAPASAAAEPRRRGRPNVRRILGGSR